MHQSAPSANAIPPARDEGAETPTENKSIACRDGMRGRIPASSGGFRNERGDLRLRKVLQAGGARLNVGAANVRTGNFVYFHTTTHTICAEHVMASGALPPGFPAIEIEGEHCWDGGLVSNAPLQWVAKSEPHRDTLAFKVDLRSAREEFPRNMVEVITREKEIRYSSRTRAATDQFKHVQKMRRAVAGRLEQLPEELKHSPEAKLLRAAAGPSVYNIVHLI